MLKLDVEQTHSTNVCGLGEGYSNYIGIFNDKKTVLQSSIFTIQSLQVAKHKGYRKLMAESAKKFSDYKQIKVGKEHPICGY